MVRKVMLGILSVLVAVSLIQVVSAHDIYSKHEPYFSYHYDAKNNAAGICYSFNDRGCDHGYPSYRYHSTLSWNLDDDDDLKSEYGKRRAIMWVGRSYESRYAEASGKTSGEFFGGTDKPAKTSTNFRYKETYDLRTQGSGNGKDYYYKPKYDSESGYYNWRY